MNWIGPPWLVPRSAYIHIPFCAHHCGYCDFAIAVGRDHLRDRYLEALRREIAGLHVPRAVRTLFLGGGTPSHLETGQLQSLFCFLHDWLPLTPGGECSIEANPESLDAEKCQLLATAGVNRVSLGAQSFRESTLKQLDRRHDPAAVESALTLLADVGVEVSLDLIFGVPGQAIDDWREDLDRAMALGTNHISTYGLTYEKGTPLWKRVRAGEVKPLDEDRERALYALAMDALIDAGFEQYEISNFAKAGQRCRHNEVYWANEAYFGFGQGAARYVDGRRERNSPSFATYLQRMERGESPTVESERLEGIDLARETAAIQLRRGDGIRRREFQDRTGMDFDHAILPALQPALALGLLEDRGGAVRLTREGKFVADAIVERIFR